MRRLCFLVLLSACGRVSFDGTGNTGGPDGAAPPDIPAPSAVDFCPTAAATIPNNATESFCVDFQGQAARTLADEEYFIPAHLRTRVSNDFSSVSVEQAGQNLAFRYQPTPSSVCLDGMGMNVCCYSDVYVDYSASVFTGQMHFEYDHYIVDAPANGWVGSVYWGGRATTYRRDLVDPPLDLGRWQHVVIDGSFGTDQPLNVTVDGVARPNSAGQKTHESGVIDTVGTFCSGAPGAGYVDNLLFYAF